MTTLGKPLFHGGDLASASRHFGRDESQWLDLSTGVNPRAYSVDALSLSAFTRLPYLRDDFMAQAATYYGSDKGVAVPGTQWAIAQLPALLQCRSSVSRVLIPELGYSEHGHQWQAQGALVTHYPATDETVAVAAIDAALARHPYQHLVLINPNNPTGLCFRSEQIQRWREQQTADSVVIVDEAFIDATSQSSILTAGGDSAGIIVLRSFGKFFGLAGLRLGFVFAPDELRQPLLQQQGLWAINGPAQALAAQAFADTGWQRQARDNIRADRLLTQKRLQPLLGNPDASGGLFSTYRLSPEAATFYYQAMAEQGVLMRVIPWHQKTSLLRTGLIAANDRDSDELLQSAVNHILGTTANKYPG